jgi:hypothetical protein
MRRLTFILGLLAAICLPLALPASAAVTANNYVTPQTPKNTKTCYVQGTDTAGTYKAIYTGGTNGSKIVAIWAGTNDDATHVATVRMSTSTSDHCATNGTCGSGVAATLAISSGYAAATPVVNLLTSTVWPGLPIDSDGNPYITLSDNTQTIEATFATAFSTAGEHVCFNVIGSDF